MDWCPIDLVICFIAFFSCVSFFYLSLTTRKVRLPKIKDLPAVISQGILGITIYPLALVFGEKTVTAGTASLIIALSPIFSSLLAFLFLNETLKKIGWLGILISFFGGILIVLGENQGFSLNIGVFLILIAAFSSSVYIVYQKPYFLNILFRTHLLTFGEGHFSALFYSGFNHSYQSSSIFSYSFSDLFGFISSSHWLFNLDLCSFQNAGSCGVKFYLLTTCPGNIHCLVMVARDSFVIIISWRYYFIGWGYHGNEMGKIIDSG